MTLFFNVLKYFQAGTLFSKMLFSGAPGGENPRFSPLKDFRKKAREQKDLNVKNIRNVHITWRYEILARGRTIGRQHVEISEIKKKKKYQNVQNFLINRKNTFLARARTYGPQYVEISEFEKNTKMSRIPEIILLKLFWRTCAPIDASM